jgi:chemotaxis protein methyltransferase CheR
MSTALRKHRYDDLCGHLANEVTRMTGVQLGEKQRSLVQVRLNKRISDLGYRSIEDYQGYYEKNESKEIQYIISLLTTHHTYFFREFSHFEFVAERALPAIIPKVRARPDKTLKVWCAAASRGQEVYSLAMFFNHHLALYGSDIKFQILGTDVDEQSVRIARNGVYPRREILGAPLAYVANHWARGTGDISDFVKARSTLRESVVFEQSNLLDPTEKFDGQKFDLIFCRNVFIYFTTEQIRSSTKMLLNHLHPWGYFFIGISESLNGLGLEVKSDGPSIYRFPEAGRTAEVAGAHAEFPAPVTPVAFSKALPAHSRPLRVFCVDDSSSIHTLLKQVLKRDIGFEIVGTAVNGLDAAQKLASLGDVDVITLDIHMPEQNGIEYLERNYSAKHPPVVILSSVSRDQSDLAWKALQLGASDFVEKPALNQLQERGEEIRAKLKSAVWMHRSKQKAVDSLDREFKGRLEIRNPETKARVVLSGYAHLEKTVALLRELSGPQPPVYLVFEGVEANLPSVAEELSRRSGIKVQVRELVATKALPGEILVVDFKKQVPELSKLHGRDRVSISVMGEIGPGSAEQIRAWRPGQLLLEDLGSGRGAECLQSAATGVFPATSFVHMGSEYLARK